MLWLADVLIGTRTLSRDPVDRGHYVQRAHRERAGAARAIAAVAGRQVRKFSAGARALPARYAGWRSRRAALRHLNGLSDHALLDIGLTRGDIYRAVLGLDDRSRQRAGVQPDDRSGTHRVVPLKPRTVPEGDAHLRRAA